MLNEDNKILQDLPSDKTGELTALKERLNAMYALIEQIIEFNLSTSNSVVGQIYNNIEDLKEKIDEYG